MVDDQAAGAESLLADALGSTIALVDNAGAVQTQYSYEPFGTTTATGAANGNVFQFTGRENDGTGLYYFRARYYHPGLQRFISEDPIGFRGGDWNLYAYVRNNPVRYRDPMGLYILEYTQPGPECIELGGRKDECGSGRGDPPPPMYACSAGCVGPSLAGDVIPFPPGPRERPYWLPPPIPGRPADVIPFRRRPAPPPIVPPWVEIFPLIIFDYPLFQRYLDSMTGRPLDI